MAAAMPRAINFFLGLISGIILLIPGLIIALLVKITSQGPIIHWSKRVGKNNILFQMPKFRTMTIGTPQIATHLMQNSHQHLTSLGPFLRKTSLDEIPQILTVLSGDMSFVGPRPALFNQDDLIKLRTENAIHTILPGVTGWAQVNGRDELSIEEKVRFDKEYLEKRSLVFDFKILLLTVAKVLMRKNINH